jgi:hypothetical protein
MNRQDVARTSKRGRSGKALARRHVPSRHHASHSSEEEDDYEMLKRHPPIERSSHIALRYSKKKKQSTINDNREAPVYEGSKQSHDPHFWSLFHSDWYHSIYHPWWRSSGLNGTGWQQGGIKSSIISKQHVMSW